MIVRIVARNCCSLLFSFHVNGRGLERTRKDPLCVPFQQQTTDRARKCGTPASTLVLSSSSKLSVLHILAVVKPKLPDDFEEKTWAKLKEAVQAVQSKRPVTCSFEELYRVRLCGRC